MTESLPTTLKSPREPSSVPRLNLLAALAALILTGCYQVNDPVLTKGEYAPVAGSYACTNRLDGSPLVDSLVEQKSGFFSPDYRYLTEDKVEVMFADLGNGLYLSQVSQKGSPIALAFMEPTAKGMEFYVVNAMLAALQIDTLSRQNGVTPHLLQTGWIPLSGIAADIKAFLASHSKGMLLPVLSCTKK